MARYEGGMDGVWSRSQKNSKEFRNVEVTDLNTYMKRRIANVMLEKDREDEKTNIGLKKSPKNRYFEC